MLLLGAGSSFGLLTQTRKQVPRRRASKILAEQAQLPYSGETLSRVYFCLQTYFRERIHTILDSY